MEARLWSWAWRSLLFLQTAAAIPFPQNQSVAVQPFKVDLSEGVPRMMELIKNSDLPDEPQYPGVEPYKGIGLDVLKKLQDQWLNEFDWDKEEEYLNSFDHYMVTLEGLDIHFVYHKSGDPDAIPLLLTHGWPGSFMEFLPVIQPLTQKAQTDLGKPVSFDVVVPSLPGFDFSSSPPGDWTLDDTARIFNTLMTEVLEYDTFAAHGTSNGAILTFTLYDAFNASTRAAHFPVMPFYSTTPEELEERDIDISPTEQFIQERAMEWTLNGTGYFLMHIYKPNTISLGLYDHPVGQLAWMGEKWISWADERAGQGPSLLTHNEILRSVSLTFLTGTFMSSIFTYSQDTDLPFVKGIIERARTDAPMLVTFFRYSVGFWPESVLRMMGELVQYRVHEFGGFFAGLENPPDLVADLRQIKTYWLG